jgi:hypothetical protein
MSQKWNLQDIKPAEPRKKIIPTEPLVKNEKPVEVPKQQAEDIEPVVVSDGTKKKNRTLLVALIVFVFVVGFGVLASILMGGAEVTINPKYREPNVNATFEAVATPRSETDLVYEIMALEAEGERQVTASGQEEVKSQAEGTIFIYNNHSPESMRLVTNTRFESSNGLIFKIKDPAVIPGYTTDENGEKQPGVVTAEVYADEVGEQYNLDPGRFTVPGFAGEPEFDNIYAESVNAFTGGFDGLKFIIDDDELITAQQSLRLDLRNSLLARIDEEMPAGFERFDGAVTFTYDSLPVVEYGENLATIKEKANMRIPLFAEAEFAKFIAAATVPGYEGEEVRLDDSSVLSFSYKNSTTSNSNIAEITGFEFKLEGRPLIIWEYDEGKLKTDLVNKNRTALNTVLGGYPAIEQAKAVIRPFWKSTFPTSLDKIDLIEVVKPEDD